MCTICIQNIQKCAHKSFFQEQASWLFLKQKLCLWLCSVRICFFYVMLNWTSFGVGGLVEKKTLLWTLELVEYISYHKLLKWKKENPQIIWKSNENNL